ncbi:hypothetical protein TSAR_004690 [Trichomalopsis sarcophagae]|uniref:Uncharacterized protein n=1 Tax=Trichomalopsis sarcophagae TaxID=543379 RepID=A0A232FFX7_9HYME|nr:hypothetical protein TSAR_004690 [Trichomalopsis sarcophagae]
MCLAATVFLTESARIPRGGVDHFPNFHTPYDGDDAISYQNVYMKSYGSVPIPLKDHNKHHEDLNHHNKEAQTAKIHKSRIICTVRLAHERRECDKHGAKKDCYSHR